MQLIWLNAEYISKNGLKQVQPIGRWKISSRRTLRLVLLINPKILSAEVLPHEIICLRLHLM